jgi:hypothetical protein
VLYLLLLNLYLVLSHVPLIILLSIEGQHLVALLIILYKRLDMGLFLSHRHQNDLFLAIFYDQPLLVAVDYLLLLLYLLNLGSLILPHLLNHVTNVSVA